MHFRHHRNSSKIWFLKFTDFFIAFTIFPAAVTIAWRGDFLTYLLELHGFFHFNTMKTIDFYYLKFHCSALQCNIKKHQLSLSCAIISNSCSDQFKNTSFAQNMTSLTKRWMSFGLVLIKFNIPLHNFKFQIAILSL